MHLNLYFYWFALVGFYGISTIVDYLMPNSFYTSMLDTDDLLITIFNGPKLNFCAQLNVSSIAV